ncbi:hypothetical protein VNO80_26814 [Phaseolus coccineus]|uniref:Uncharacterized protein n=1 Tax=Phaseolus coccineus TaxID=3886 RepID=A0AAN9QH19_PHACN
MPVLLVICKFRESGSFFGLTSVSLWGKTRIQFFNIPDLGFVHGHAFCILSDSGLDLGQWVSTKIGTLVLGVVVSVKG